MSGLRDWRTLVYLIDGDFRIVYSNQDLKSFAQDAEQPHCYEIIGGEHRQCSKCPLKKENAGQSVLFDHLHKEWVYAMSAPIEVPGIGDCHAITMNSVEQTESCVNNFCAAADMPRNAANATGGSRIYSKKRFFQRAEETMRQDEAGISWCVLAIDIEKLQLYNEWHGRDAGNALLADIIDFLKEFQDRREGIAGYFGNDDFALLIPYDENRIERLYQELTALIKARNDQMYVMLAFGIYEFISPKVSVVKAYDLANLACARVKGNYAVRIKKFRREMLEDLKAEFLLFSDVQRAFREHEFTFVLQPKCNIKSGKIIGSEALARWYSKENGILSPAVFIPFLEKIGYLPELDTYIWEEVCKWQRGELDCGRRVLPVSVNVSRVDLYDIDVPAYFNDLIRKYDLNPKLLEIEITENAYAEDDGMVDQAVTKLQQAGFKVLMDDFGSAYSSLNMLKDIAVDALKIDMRFLKLHGSNMSKGLGILETVCNMAGILGIDIIVEGVETEEQRKYLLSMHCRYAQGYYFYRPLSVADFSEAMDHSADLEDEDIGGEEVQHLYLKDLLRQDMFSEIMINNMLGAVVFYDVHDGIVDIIRYNERYAALLGYDTFSIRTRLRVDELIDEENYKKMFFMFAEARSNRQSGSEADIRRRRMSDGKYMWLNLHTFFLHERDGHTIYYCSATDVTKLHQTDEMLNFLNDNLPGGYYRHKNNEDCDFTHISQRFLDIFGFTREEIRERFDDKLMNMVHPDDREMMLQSVAAAAQNGRDHAQACRMRSKNGYIHVVHESCLVQFDSDTVFQGIVFYDSDIAKNGEITPATRI